MMKKKYSPPAHGHISPTRKPFVSGPAIETSVHNRLIYEYNILVEDIITLLQELDGLKK